MVSISVLLIVFLITFLAAAAAGRRGAETDEPVRLLNAEMDKL
ncbi:hypothetical protein [uncultured Arthrobacter sp.]